MAKKATPIEKAALIELWGKKCALGTEYLGPGVSVEIEHVIPKSVKPPALAQAISDFSLPAGFSVHSPENWVPSCRVHNNQKSDEIVVDKATQRLLKKAAEYAKELPNVVSRMQDEEEFSELVAKLEDKLAGKQSVQAKLARAAVRGVVRGALSMRSANDLYLPSIRLTWVNVAVPVNRPPIIRPLWLIEPEGHERLAVVTENQTQFNEGGSLGIENGQNYIARHIARKYPGYVTVLHYVDEPDWTYQDWWTVVPMRDGAPSPDESLSENPEVREALYAAGLRSPSIGGQDASLSDFDFHLDSESPFTWEGLDDRSE